MAVSYAARKSAWTAASNYRGNQRRMVVRRGSTGYKRRFPKKYQRKYQAIAPKSEVKRTNQGAVEEVNAAGLSVIQGIGNIQQGTDSNERIGNKVNVIGLQIRLVASTTSNNLVYGRLFVFSIANAASGSKPIDVDTAIFKSPLGSFQSLTDISDTPSMIWNQFNDSYFTVHYEKIFKISEAQGREGNDTYFFKRLVKMRQVVEFNRNNVGESQQSHQFGCAVIFYNPRSNQQPAQTLMKIGFDATLYYTDS